MCNISRWRYSYRHNNIVSFLIQKIDSLYKDHVETNDLRNRRAERNALNEYQRRMDDLISPKPMWALIVPWIITLAKRRSYHEDCKYYAIRYFRNERCGSSKYDEDSYYDDLIWVSVIQTKKYVYNQNASLNHILSL